MLVAVTVAELEGPVIITVPSAMPTVRVPPLIVVSAMPSLKALASVAPSMICSPRTWKHPVRSGLWL